MRSPFVRRLVAGLGAGCLTLSMLGPRVAQGAAPTLTRLPYLTDMTSTSVAVNFATDTDSPHPVVSWGPAGGACNTSTTGVTAHQMTVAGQTEYQFLATLSGLSPSSSYCYALTQAGVNLLGATPSPVFTTFPVSGTTVGFSFAVFGDWGDVGTSGTNPDEANVLAHVASSHVNFVMTVGDNSYPGGSQTNFGDLIHTGTSTSEVFGGSFWPRFGSGVPGFLPMGNHGMSSGSTYLTDWPQAANAAASGGTYQLQTYCCLDGTNSANYPSAWFAFDYGQARFYFLEAAWANSNVGTGNLYKDDFDYHWTPSSPEYRWLAADLAAHASTPLKFAFFHFPLHSDNATETTDTYLDGPGGLEGLLASNGVDIAFSGHTHLYERNLPQVGSMLSYVTGGGGAPLEPVSTCSAFDAYAIGWSYSKNAGSTCRGSTPASITQVFHFLLVTVSGTQVTVAPTDENGNRFDVQTYALGG